MISKVKDFVKESKPAQLVLALLLGMFIGAIFYPTKHIEERLETRHEEELKKIRSEHSTELSKKQEEITKLESSFKQYKTDTEMKISSLTTQVTTLKSKQKTAYYKIVRPDGTIEERQFTETDIDASNKVVTSIQAEFKQKVDSIEKKWSQVHEKRVAELQKEFRLKEEEYKKTVDELKKERIVDINKKSFGVEAGMLLDSSYYGHATYDVMGPFFLGLHSQFGSNSNTVGAGLGIRF